MSLCCLAKRTFPTALLGRTTDTTRRKSPRSRYAQSTQRAGFESFGEASSPLTDTDRVSQASSKSSSVECGKQRGWNGRTRLGQHARADSTLAASHPLTPPTAPPPPQQQPQPRSLEACHNFYKSVPNGRHISLGSHPPTPGVVPRTQTAPKQPPSSPQTPR